MIEGKQDGWIDQWMDGGSKGQEGVTSLDLPAVSPVGAACVAAGRLSPLPANRSRAGIAKHPPVTQSRVCFKSLPG